MASDRLLRLLAPALIAAAALPAAPAAAAGGLQIAPAKLDVAVRKGDELPPIRVRNDSPRPVSVDVTAVRAGQELSGLPRYELSRAAVREGRGFLAVSPARFRLAPGQSRPVQARVTGGPTHGRGAYGVVLVRGRIAARGEGSVVTPVVRLAANVLLRYPGGGAAGGPVTELRGAQAGPRQLDLIARVANRGRIHAAPDARLTIRDDRGRVVLRQAVPSGNVLPSFEREFPVRLAKVLKAGRYEARVDARLGRRKSSRKLEFTLVGPNELPTPALEIAELATPAPAPGEPFSAAVRVANRGTAPAGARGELLVGPAGGEPAHRADLSLDTVEPGQERRVEQRVPGVAAGDHELTVRLMDGDRVVAERTLVFTAAAGAAWTERLLEWVTAHLVVVLGGAIALILAVAVYAVARIRRLKRRLREHATVAPFVRI